MAIIQIDNITAAGCQIDTAVELFFSNGDIISQIALICGAWDIINDILKTKETSTSHVRYYMKTSIKNKVEELYNFLKHAEKSYNKNLQFEESIVEPLLFGVIHDLSLLQIRSETMNMFYNWFISRITDEENTKAMGQTYLDAIDMFPDIKNTDPKNHRKVGYKALQSLLSSRT